MLWELDHELFFWLNTRLAAAPLDWLGAALQDPWWLWAPLGAVAIYLLVRGDRRDRLFVVSAILAVVLTDVFCAQVLKPLIGRLRPSIALEGVRLVVGKKSGYSMPSNHAANIAAAALLLSLHWRKLAWWALGIALLVGASRVYVGVHYPLDIVSGYAVGVAMAGLVVVARENAERWFERRQAVRDAGADSKIRTPS